MEIRILVADDHEVVRRGLREIVRSRPGWTICGEAVSGREAVLKAKQLKPHVVVMDVSMPDLNGLEATRQVLQAVPGTEVLVLTVHESEQVTREVLQTGARGCVLKSDAGRHLVAAIQALLQHRTFFTPNVSEMVLRGYLGNGHSASKEPSPRNALTPREREVVQLLAEGRSNKEVATMLGISVKTVEAHRANIMRKLQLHSSVDLARYAIRNKMVQP
jgi:DNA-binding NarL/FixJ family response regulator